MRETLERMKTLGRLKQFRLSCQSQSVQNQLTQHAKKCGKIIRSRHVQAPSLLAVHYHDRYGSRVGEVHPHRLYTQ